jgi:Fe-S-cluster containining protein
MPLVTVPQACKGCAACCYNLMVALEPDHRVPDPDLIEKGKSGGWEMKQRKDGSCLALNRDTLLCTIYEHRPECCRMFNPEGNELCLERVYARQKTVMDDVAEGVEALLKAAADFAMSRGFAPTMRPVYWPSGTKTTVYMTRTFKTPDIRAQIRDESLLRMRGALSVVTQVREVSQLRALYDWAVERKRAREGAATAYPVQGIRKRTAVETWDHVIRHLEGLLPHEEPLEGEEPDA